MASIPNGCVFIARQIRESEIWVKKPAWWLKVWLFILMQVNHSDNRFFPRGENLFTYKMILDGCCIPEATQSGLEGVIKWVRKAGMITTRKTTRGVVITVLNYDIYQKLSSYESQSESQSESHTKSRTKAGHKPDISHTINKNDKNDKNEKNTIGSEAKVLLDYFFTQYQKKHNTKYIVNGAKDITLLKTLLQSLSSVQIKACIDSFFVSSDTFISRSDYGIGVFKSQINKLILAQNEVPAYREFPKC